MSAFDQGIYSVEDIAGAILPGSKLFFYTTGTTTPLATYSDQALTTPNANPVVAGADGRFGPIWLQLTSYKVVLKTAADVTLVTRDPVRGDIDTGLTALLAASSGSSLVGFLQAGTGVVARTVEDALRGTVSVKDFGALGDSATNDTAAINKAVLALANRGGGRLVFDAVAGFYKVNGPVYIPSNIVIDLNGQTLKGAGSTTGVMFETATVEAGVLTSNIGTPAETKLVMYAGLCNGRVENVAKVCNFYDFVIGCFVRDVMADNCRQFGEFKNCFYLHMENCLNRGTNVAGFYAFDFTGVNNAIQLLRCSATKEYGFRFTGGGAPVTMISCTTEGGGGIAVKVVGDQTISIQDHYAEAWSGTVYDFSQAGTCSVRITNSWLNGVDIAFQDGGADNGAVLIGTWDSTNRISNIAAAPARGLMNINGNRNFIQFEYGGDQNDTAGAASNWVTSKNTNFRSLINFNADGVTDIRAKTWDYKSGIIPLNYKGDVGAPFSGQIEFSTVTYPTGGSVTLTVLSKIVYQAQGGRATFFLDCTSNTGSFKVFGEIYGNQVKQHDSSGKTVTLTNVGGMMQLNVAGLNNTDGLSACTGIFRIAA